MATDYVPETVREAARLRLNNRLERLTRLREINAPTVIIAKEVLLVIDAIWLLDPDAMSSSLSDREHRRVKTAAGFCTYEMVDCGELANDPVTKLCVAHQKEYEGEKP
jgi:hypothetical protein